MYAVTMTKPPNHPFPVKPGKRPNLFLIAYKNFPRGVLETMTGVAFLTAHTLFYYIQSLGVESVALAVVITGIIIALLPLSTLYIFTLLRSTRIRRRIENEAQHQLEILSDDLQILKARELKEEKEVLRLEREVEFDIKARKIKDEKEDERWDLLAESLRQQNETSELASEERLLVAQQVKDIKEEGEVIRKGLASDDLEARHVKDRKEDKRWDVLTESLRLQNETVELASEERLLVAQQVKELKDEGEVMRKGLASDDLEARHIKEHKDEKRWEALHERLRIQEERSEERDRQQLLRDKEYVRMRHEDEIKDQYKKLFSRYIRNQDTTLSREVADGLAPIPEVWLKGQPEILKNPALMLSIQQYNAR